MRLDRPIGTLLLMWPALWGLWIAGAGSPPTSTVIVFVLGVILMRAAGCAINDYADRNFDAHVARTCNRPLATKEITSNEAIAIFLILSLIAFALVLTQNLLTIAMSFIAVLLTAIYPFMKRITHIPQLVLGTAFGWAVPMAFTAIRDQVPILGWQIFFAVILWAIIYDTQYAMVDRNDDLKIGIKSTAILFGRNDRLIIGLLQGLMILVLVSIGIATELNIPYYSSLIIGIGLFLYQQYLIRNRDPKDCLAAFLHNNYFGMCIFTGILLDYAVY
ncbi:4-hydroxybenzoate polyprenyltransferase [Achromatium sp. WMS3]|nr:4-hydroxybenzoate polyprenyltransferase [Achromatium sp. WMS3]